MPGSNYLFTQSDHLAHVGLSILAFRHQRLVQAASAGKRVRMLRPKQLLPKLDHAAIFGFRFCMLAFALKRIGQ